MPLTPARNPSRARRSLLIGALAIASLVPAAPATARGVVLEHPTQPVTWAGGPIEGVGVPEPCSAPGCDEIALDVELPAGQLKGPGGVQVAIRWASERDNLDLFVYAPDGRLAAQSAAPVSTAESLLLPLADRSWRVVVVAAGSGRVRFEGLAQVERPIEAAPARDLLPDLVSLPVRRPQVATSAYLFDLPVPGLPTGCYPEETLEFGATRCLRFDQPIANIGEGPFEIRYRLEDAAETQALDQRIHRSDGSWRDVRAGRYVFHPTHAHFHFADFAQARLWRSNARGERLGAVPVRTGHKQGFCMLDVELTWWGLRGDGPRRYTPPGGCVAANDVDPAAGTLAAVNGISVGWTDVYFWYVPGQYVEITGVPDGHYLVETVSDPADAVAEIDETNNAAVTHIELCGDAAQVVGQAGPC